MANADQQPSQQMSGLTPIIVNQKRQRGNPLLKHVRSVPYEWGEMKPDFELGTGACAVFLSLAFHKLHPEYIDTRFREIGHTYALQVLLVCVNVEEPRNQLRELNMLCVRTGWTLLLAHSTEEAAEYLESFKKTEHRSGQVFRQAEAQRRQRTTTAPDLFATDQNATDASRKSELNAAIEFLTVIRSVNRSDAQRLLAEFGSIARIAQLSEHALALVPGLGSTKAKYIYDAFRAPFLVEQKSKPTQPAKSAEATNEDAVVAEDDDTALD